MIVITAPTSQIGSQLLSHLTDRADLRVIARDPSRLPQKVRDQAGVVVGSHGEPETIRAALEGADTVFWLVPPNPLAADVVAYYRRFTAPLCDAIAEHRPRVVYVSTLGRSYDREAGHLSAALAMDEMIEQTGVAFRALRMPFFMENLAGQADAITNQAAFYLPNDVDRTLLTVATRDIADTAANLLLDESWSDQRSVPVIGPDNLSPRQMAEVVSDVLGQHVHAQHVPAEQYQTMMTGYGLNAGFVRSLIEMATAQDDGIYDNDAANAPRSATSFDQWCRDTLRPPFRDEHEWCRKTMAVSTGILSRRKAMTSLGCVGNSRKACCGRWCFVGLPRVSDTAVIVKRSIRYLSIRRRWRSRWRLGRR